MGFAFNSQIIKEGDNDTTKYHIQIITDDKNQYLFMQEMARECIDGEHKEKQGDTETFAEHYGCLPSNLSLEWDDIESPTPLVYTDVPNCCKACPNHPSNGGSGICNCTAPYFEQGFTCTCTTQNSNITKE